MLKGKNEIKLYMKEKTQTCNIYVKEKINHKL